MRDQRDRLLMTPGPTALPPAVREAMTRPIHNPDVESEFTERYRELLGKLASVYRTDDDLVILAGEGMLGLEASVSSLVAPGETVLCLSNGLFGAGFADLVETHGGEAVLHEVPGNEGFDVESVEEAIETHEPAVATMVHCETPTGVLNDLDGVLAALDEAGVLTVVDAVSSLGGTPVPEGIDVCLGASQKCLSSPPGLSLLSVSDAVWTKVESTEQDSFYASLEPWRELSFDDPPAAFPYTHSVSNVYALEASVDRLLEEGLESAFERHEAAAARCRERGREIDLEPFAPDGLASPTVTALSVEGRAEELQKRVAEDHGVVLSTGLGEHADDLLRVGHMGYNADLERVDRTMDALSDALD
ncbi:pyridoxal-phosphate-dependent aminotransferase family protein [Halalkalicoccus ordinarius]|uniref:pyridoxal-phosphate-dependent aminotransferase family protein n=1 Tax=Halalkalicoccus ordinarius TaxID=3116651 RepID=UPI00300EA34B